MEKIKRGLYADNPIVLIRGCPTPYIKKPTPTSGYIDECEISESVSFFVGLYELLNLKPFSVKGENGDRIIRHVVPSESIKGQIGSQGYKYAFGTHVDNPHLLLMSENCDENSKIERAPEILGLLSQRAQYDVSTNIIMLKDIVNILPKEVTTELLKNNFLVNSPESFSNQSNRIVPLLVKYKNTYISRFDMHNVKPMTTLAKDAFSYLKKTIDEFPKSRIVLTEGDMLLFNNQLTIHSRDSFKTCFNGNERWLIRIYGNNKNKDGNYE
ncbi:hypothetical protein MS2017_1703 [Bathymodiolus thermophilus thioautotrophic gill symbiont]|uniref:Uncharacterized protein n=1 Tax=Bathymodiolus thermophilus thioautotrophic gill symbiont TaxID=2360 RepID=A0A3G3INE3_9GAMM|nr:TauD/TfdA family dioxygenase [Bathymodiolus thermophilus thioautotrophic gill symbiont]AYQ57377.1 hypothetical protein MS2017_1703 [Bathymodiolus thermophilus thioautotrophic gill symbiont]